MAQSLPTLGEVIGLNIQKDKPVNCLFILKNGRQCRNRIAKDRCNKAHTILQYQVTFQVDEQSRIQGLLKMLAKYLIHGDEKHPRTSDDEKKAYQEKWLDMWLTRAEEHRKLHEGSLVVTDSCVSYTPEEIVESSEDESLEDEVLEPTTPSSAITYRSPLLQDTPAPAPEPKEPHILPTPPAPLQILNRIQPSKKIIKKNNAVLVPSEISTTPETSALGVFMTPSQRMIFQHIIQTVSQFLLAARMQFSSTSSTNEAGHAEKQSVFELDMLLRVRIPMSGILSSVYGSIAFQIVTCGFVYTFLGFTQALSIIFLTWFMAWCSQPRKPLARSIQA